MRLRGQPPPPPEPEAQFEELQASVLFCGRSRAPRPVRERLLLVLPDGELREYVCSACGESAGSRRLSRPPPEILLR